MAHKTIPCFLGPQNNNDKKQQHFPWANFIADLAAFTSILLVVCKHHVSTLTKKVIEKD